MEYKLKKLIEFLVKKLVEEPGAVSIQEISSERTVILVLRVGNKDIEKVTGQKGEIAGALRILLMAASLKEGKRYILQILDSKPTSSPDQIPTIGAARESIIDSQSNSTKHSVDIIN